MQENPPILKQLQETWKHQNVQAIFGISRVVSTVAFFASLFFFVLYCIGYSFLSGWYFGGELGKAKPLLSNFVNPVPFNLYTVILLGIIVSLLLVVLIYLMVIASSPTKSNLTVYFLMVIGVQLGFAFLFAAYDNWKSLFWIAPMFLIIIGVWVSLTKGRWYTGTAGIFYGLLLVLYSNLFLKINWDPNMVVYTLLFVILPVSVLTNLGISKIQHDYLSRTISHFPFLFLSSQFFISTWIGFFAGLFISVVSSIVLAYLQNLVPHYLRTFRKQGNPIEKVDSRLLVPLLAVFTIMLLTVVPFASQTIGQSLRSSLDANSFDIITYQNGKEMIGKIVAEKNGTFYISNQDWQLVMIKSDEVSTTPQK